MSYGDDFKNFKKAKDKLLVELKDLNLELNQFLALPYGIDSSKPKIFNKWLSECLPFHWFAEFYEIIHDKGGFDIIIGNPPYVVYTEKGSTYKVKDYSTISCSNLYAYCCERSFRIMNKNGRFGMIIPNSSISADKLNPLQKLFKQGKETWISNYSWRPSKLFDGADMLLAIILSVKNDTSKTHSTMYYKWYNEYRSELFYNLNYNDVTNYVIEGSIPKMPSKLYFSIIEKVKESVKSKKTVLNYFNPSITKHKFFYFRAVQYWVKILDKEPLFLEDGVQTTTGEMKPVYAESDEVKNILISLLSSNLYFVHYITWASCQVINSRDFEFLIDIDTMSNDIKKGLSELGKKIQKDYQKNSHNVTRNYSKKGRDFTMEKQHFYIKKSKALLDEVDVLLAKHFKFNKEELDFIVNYDIKYRLGKDLEGEDE